MFHWIFDAPLWLTGPLLVALLVGFSLLGVQLVRTRVLPRLRVGHEDAHFVGTIVHSIMVFYGLVLALIAVNLFETYAESERVVSTEATAIGAFYRDTEFYPEPTRGELGTGVRDYLEHVIHEEWPLQRRGQVPEGGVEKMARIQSSLQAFEPATKSQEILHAEALHAYNRFVETRRARLDQVQSGLPGVMWLVVVLGAVISLSAAFFFKVTDERLHGILVSLLAVFIASVIFVMLALDHPFRGDLGVRPESYQLIYDHMMKP